MTHALSRLALSALMLAAPVLSAHAGTCDSSVGPFSFSCDGPGPGTCTKLLETADPHTWADNYFCSTTDLGLRWSSAGPISGMRCTQIREDADPHTWNDNFLCTPKNSPYRFSWSSAGPIGGKTCIQWNEPSDPHTWNDNFLCWGNAADTPDPARLQSTLATVQCLKPATGIELGAVSFLNGFTDGFNTVWGPTAPLLALGGPKAAVAVGVVDASIAAVGAGTNIASAIDSNRSPDDLYIKIDGRRVWPSADGDREVRGGQTLGLNLAMGTGAHRIELWEADANTFWSDDGANDDLLGDFTFTPAKTGPITFQVISKEEDSHYLIQVNVTAR